mmetsp:Transcript_14463/g.43062  ORF Transcript_14463/g.43062 Transcript_14463/m.43062 type:complete len:237 (+) Transcript_14463:582-1292(+)
MSTWRSAAAPSSRRRTAPPSKTTSAARAAHPPPASPTSAAMRHSSRRAHAAAAAARSATSARSCGRGTRRSRRRCGSGWARRSAPPSPSAVAAPRGSVRRGAAFRGCTCASTPSPSTTSTRSMRSRRATRVRRGAEGWRWRGWWACGRLLLLFAEANCEVFGYDWNDWWGWPSLGACRTSHDRSVGLTAHAAHTRRIVDQHEGRGLTRSRAHAQNCGRARGLAPPRPDLPGPGAAS